MTTASARVPSTGYSISLIVALVGITFVTFALAGVILERMGRDPIGAMGAPGLIAFVSSYGFLFLARLIFSPTRSERLQARVRNVISITLVIELIAAVLAVLLLMTTDRSTGTILSFFVTFALLCQIGTVLWLVRYRAE